MFTKEKLEKWIVNLCDVISDLESLKGIAYKEEPFDKEIELIYETKHALESMLATINNEEI